MTAVAPDQLAAVPGDPASAIPVALAAELPAPAPAPWSCRLEAVVFWFPATRAARALLPEALRGRGRALPLTTGALVRYLDTPVGPYSEVLASPVVLVRPGTPAAHIPFIAVDSLASVAGGRANWALPKTLGRFAWPAAPGGLGAVRGRPLRASAVGEGWSVAVQGVPRGPRVPFALPAGDLQVTPGGAVLDAPVRLRGRARHCLVRLRSTGASLPAWLPERTCGGAVLSDVTAHVGAPR